MGILGELYWCEYNFTEDQCGQQLEILIEAWTFTNTMVSTYRTFTNIMVSTYRTFTNTMVSTYRTFTVDGEGKER